MIFGSIQNSIGHGPVRHVLIGPSPILSGLGVELGPPEVPSNCNIFAIPKLNIPLFSNLARKEQSWVPNFLFKLNIWIKNIHPI